MMTENAKIRIFESLIFSFETKARGLFGLDREGGAPDRPTEPSHTRKRAEGSFPSYTVSETPAMDPAAGSSSSSIGGATGNNPLDLRNLLNIDRADRVFQELLRQVAVQSAEIRELRQLLARCVTQEMLQKVGAALQVS